MNEPQTGKHTDTPAQQQPAEDVHEQERLANAYSANRSAAEGLYGTLGPRPGDADELAHATDQADTWAAPETTPPGQHASAEAKNQRQTGRQSGDPSGNIKKERPGRS